VRVADPRERVVHDHTRRDFRDPSAPRPVRIYEWPPTTPTTDPAPVVLVSHGTGGSGSAMGGLAEPLADAGFRVVAVDHHGNDFVGGYHPAGFLFLWERPRDLVVALDAIAEEAPLGPVAAAGFSAGGYTAAALVGARIDPRVVRMLLDGAVPMPFIPEYPDALPDLRAALPPDDIEAAIAAAGADLSDPRVRAAFLVAPGAGPLLTPESLAGIDVPVAVRWGGADDLNPYDVDVRPHVDLVPGVDARCVGPDVRHQDFIAPLVADPTVRDAVAREAAGFLRAAVAA
jgi:predicted dienelactone hydrolase